MKDRDIRKGVVASVIASILIIIFIQPILVWTWNTVVALTPNLLYLFLNNVYINAALGQRDWIVPGIVSITLGIFAMFIFYKFSM